MMSGILAEFGLDLQQWDLYPIIMDLNDSKYFALNVNPHIVRPVWILMSFLEKKCFKYIILADHLLMIN